MTELSKYTASARAFIALLSWAFLADLALSGSVGAAELSKTQLSSDALQRLKPYDMRRSQLAGVRAGTTEVSAGAIGVAMYGDDPAFIDAVERAVNHLRQEGLPINVVWGNGKFADRGMGIDVIVHGSMILPAGPKHPPFAVRPDANFLALAILDSFHDWQAAVRSVQD